MRASKSQINYITPAGLAKLREEYRQLFHSERPKIVETVAWAASNGDRSENADYIYGKRRLRQIDSRLRFLSGRIEAAQVIDPATVQSAKVVFGATVTFESEEGLEQTITLVGEDESDPRLKRISWKSPYGAALLGKAVGEEAVVKRPAGDIYLTVIKIQFVDVSGKTI